MKRCKICGQLCDDAVKVCPACKNSEFFTERTPYSDAYNTGSNPWMNNDQNVENNPWTNNNQNIGNNSGMNNNQNVGNNPWMNNDQNMANNPNMNYGMPMGFQTGGEKMSRRTFYKRCIPPALKNQMTAAYIILALNLIIFAAMGIIYEEKQRFLDVAILAVIFLGLLFTKHVIFAVIDVLYFGISFLLTIVTRQTPTGYLAVIIAAMLIPATSRMGKLWRRYKRTGEYIDYTTFVPVKRRWPVYLVSVLIVLILGGAGLYLMSGGSGAYEEGKWDGNIYENEYLEFQMELPVKSGWKISDEEELEELNSQTENEAGFANTEKFDFLVSNSSKSASVMLLHMKSSLSEEDAFEQIKNSLVESFRKEYGSTPNIVDSGEEVLAGKSYHFVTVKGTLIGLSLYQSIYVRKEGREICELGFSGLSEDVLEELRGYITYKE